MVSTFVHDPPYLKRGVARIDWGGIAALTVGLTALPGGPRVAVGDRLVRLQRIRRAPSSRWCSRSRWSCGNSTSGNL